MTAPRSSALDLDVYGNNMRILVDHREKSHAQFFYDHFPPANGSPHLTVELRSHSSEYSFFDSFLANTSDPKEWRFENHRTGFSYVSRFSDWDQNPAFIPPFIDPTFRQQYGVYSGAVVARNKRTLLILGENYVGKTRLMWTLVNKLGWGLLSDSLVIASADDGLVLPYQAPIGFRRALRREVLPRIAAAGIETRATVSQDTGEVLLVRPRSVVRSLCTRPRRVTESVLLSHDASLNGQRLPFPKIPWYGAAPPDESMPNTAKVVTASTGTPTQIAQEISLD